MNLLIDIGNSTTVAAIYDGSTIRNAFSIQTADLVSQFDRLNMRSFRRVVISSVVPRLNALFSAYEMVHFVDYESIPRLRVDVHSKFEVGADRLVNALGALVTYNTGCLVVDSGTAITFCVVESDGTYRGGSIFPGMGIASKALSLFTAKIPTIYVAKQSELLGKTTQQAVEIGLYAGYSAMISGMIAQYKQQFPHLKVVGTGKGLEVLLDRLPLDVYDEALIFKGLRFVCESLDLK